MDLSEPLGELLSNKQLLVLIWLTLAAILWRMEARGARLERTTVELDKRMVRAETLLKMVVANCKNCPSSRTGE